MAAVVEMVEMVVQEAGTVGAPAVVFLHGAGASASMWAEHIDALQPDFHCLAPDLPGFGRSNRMAFLSRPVTADLVADLVAQRVPAGRAHVVALSWGGGVAHTLLDRHPDVVDRAVIDGAGVLTTRSGTGWLAGVAAVSPFLHTGPVSRLLARMVGMDEAGRADLLAASPRAFRGAFVEGFRSGVSRVEVRATSPTLLVAGEKETLVRSANAALAALMPHAEARYAPGLWHGWFAQETALHVAMVRAWLTGQPVPAGLPLDEPTTHDLERLLRELGEDPRRTSLRRAAA